MRHLRLSASLRNTFSIATAIHACATTAFQRRSVRDGSQGNFLTRLPQGGNVEFVMFEDVDGMEVFVNPDRVIWIREYPDQTTVISCGHDDKFKVRLAPAHAVAALGKAIR